MKAIMAMAKNRCIGKEDKIPWYHPDDFKWFKEFTMGKRLVVGRKTFKTLPVKLKGRNISVITTEKGSPFYYGSAFDFENAHRASIESVIEESKSPRNWEFVIIGGKSIYEQFMPHITEFYVTQLNAEHEGDTFMSPFEDFFIKREIIKEFDFGQVLKYSK